ncbi:WD repeat-containing protein 6 [Diplodia seriata]
MSAPLHHACTRTPVTALAFAGRLILTAEGPFLRVFLKNGSDCLFTEKIFENQTVHGLVVVDASRPDYSSVIAYGGQLVRYLRLSHDEDARTFSLDQGPAARVSDWVLDLAHPFQELNPPPSSSSPATVAVTAHNQIVRLCWTSSSPSTFLTVSNLTVSSRCILYSAHLSWLSAAKVLVASGTAFGEILVWSCDFSDLEKPRSCVHHFFTGHEGSVFGVQISPPFFVSEDQTQLLASCSDDRTVRIWDISRLPDGGDFSTSDDALGLVQDRETGFGANVNSDQDDCLAVAWGHTSRVWAIRFVEFSPSNRVRRFVSFGEDATSRVWDLDCTLSGHDQAPQRLKVAAKLIDTRAFHSGKNIWAMDLAASPQPAGFEICTGAADSAIISHHWPWMPVESVSPQPTTDAHRCCSFVSDRLVISATNSGKIIRGSNDNDGFVWDVIDQNDELKGYSVSTSEVETVQSCAVFELHAPETVTSLAWIPHDSSTLEPNHLGYLISTGRDGHYATTEIHINSHAIVAHQVSLPFGPNIEGCFVDRGSLIVYGFRGKHFVVINASTEQEIFSVECGGAHRIWSFCPSDVGEGDA